MLTDDQRLEFERAGILALRGAVSADVVGAFRDHIRSFLKKGGVDPDDPGYRSPILPSKLRGATRQHRFDGVWGPTVIGAVDAIVGAGQWKLPENPGQLLSMNFPGTDMVGRPLAAGACWELPSRVWHLDYQAPGWLPDAPGIQIFLCVDQVEPHAGATLGIAGSHRLIDRVRLALGPAFEGKSADVRRELEKQVPWYRALCSDRPGEDRVARFMESSTEHEGVSLRVVAFAGAPGDVVLMHPWIVHAPSSNCGTRARMVLTERLRRQ